MDKDFDKLLEFSIKLGLAKDEKEFMNEYCYGATREYLFNDPNGLNYIALFQRACDTHNCIPATLFEYWDEFRLNYIGEDLLA